MDAEKTSKSRGKEKEGVTGTSSKRSIQEVLEKARGESTCTEPVNKRSRHEEVKVTNLDEEDKVRVINLGDHDINWYLHK